MEPRIQYAQTEDGVSVAYWAIEQARAYDLVSRRATLVRFEYRGLEPSGRNVEEAHGLLG